LFTQIFSEPGVRYRKAATSTGRVVQNAGWLLSTKEIIYGIPRLFAQYSVEDYLLCSVPYCTIQWIMNVLL